MEVVGCEFIGGTPREMFLWCPYHPLGQGTERGSERGSFLIGHFNRNVKTPYSQLWNITTDCGEEFSCGAWEKWAFFGLCITVDGFQFWFAGSLWKKVAFTFGLLGKERSGFWLPLQYSNHTLSLYSGTRLRRAPWEETKWLKDH